MVDAFLFCYSFSFRISWIPIKFNFFISHMRLVKTLATFFSFYSMNNMLISKDRWFKVSFLFIIYCLSCYMDEIVINLGLFYSCRWFLFLIIKIWIV